MASTKDPTEAMRLEASRYPEVDEGTACTQSAFKTGKRAFLYVGEQGGRYKAMFKLEASMPDAVVRARNEPDRFEVGTNAWVTARFSAGAPMLATLWRKWLDESYQLSRPTSKTTKKKTPQAKK